MRNCDICLSPTPPSPLQGPFSPEEDAELRQLYESHGPKWGLIGAELGRMDLSCRDRWRIIGKQDRGTGEGGEKGWM